MELERKHQVRKLSDFMIFTIMLGGGACITLERKRFRTDF